MRQRVNRATRTVSVSAHVDKASIIPGAEPWSHLGQSSVGVLCIHGFTGNPSSMRGLAQAMADAGHHVELPRLPGHGTDVSDMIPTRWKDWTSEVERAFGVLKSRVDKVVVAGLSMGGSLTLWTALHHPDVVGIICINPAAQPQAQEMIDMVKSMLDQGTQVIDGIGSDIADPNVKESAYPQTPLAPLVSMVEEGIVPMVPKYPSCKVPMLLITSKNDHVVDPVQSDQLAQQWGGPVDRILLDRSFHVATQDFDRVLINEAAATFVATVTKK